MSGDDRRLQAKLDSVVSTRAALTQLYCNQRSLEAEAGMVEVDLAHMQVLMKKYGAENFLKGEGALLEERAKVSRKLAKVASQIHAMDGHVQANLAYAQEFAQPRRTSPPRSAQPSPSWPASAGASPGGPTAAAIATATAAAHHQQQQSIVTHHHHHHQTATTANHTVHNHTSSGTVGAGGAAGADVTVHADPTAAAAAGGASAVYPSIPPHDDGMFAALPGGEPMVTQRVPTFADSRILSNSVEFMGQGRHQR